MARLLALGLCLAGCATGGNGVRTLREVQTNVSWAMQGFREVGISGMYTNNQREQVNAAYAAYKNAYRQALGAAGGNESAPARARVTQAAEQLAQVFDAV